MLLHTLWWIHWIIDQKNTYCGWTNFFAAVRYLRLIWVVGGANHWTRGSWEVTGPNCISACLACWQSLLFESRPFSYTTRTSFGVRWAWNCWTTWGGTGFYWQIIKTWPFIQNFTRCHGTDVICLTKVRMPSLAVVCWSAALCLVARGGWRCTRGGRGRGVFAASIGDGAGPNTS